MFSEIEESKYQKFKHFHAHECETKEQLSALKLEVEEYFNWISKNSSVPYVVTLGECEEKGLIGVTIEDNGKYNDFQLQGYVKAFIENINGPEITQKNLTTITGENDLENRSYHCCKIMYLVDQVRTVGLDSTMQAVSEGKNMFVHPGMSRIHALWYLKARDTKIVFWDNMKIFSDKTPLTFKEWTDIFTIEGKTTFATNVGGKILEVHMQEDRPSIAGSVQAIRSMFDFKPPLLIGECEDAVLPYVTTEGASGVAIETKNNYTLKLPDLAEILGLFPESCERIEKENFSIYKI